MSIDTLGDFLTVIRNGVSASKPFVVVPHSRLKQQIAEILKEEGFIRDYALEDAEDAAYKTIKVLLKYVGGESVIHEIDRVSTPGRRIYKGSTTMTPVIGGLGIAILTTNRGVMTDKKAKALGIGGECICTVW